MTLCGSLQTYQTRCRNILLHETILKDDTQNFMDIYDFV